MEFSDFQLQEKLADDAKIRRVVLCTGKVYFDLVARRREQKIDDIAILRVEQLFPFPFNTLATELARYKNAEFVWAQEEPENMGAWSFVDRKIERVLASLDLGVVGRFALRRLWTRRRRGERCDHSVMLWMNFLVMPSSALRCCIATSLSVLISRMFSAC